MRLSEQDRAALEDAMLDWFVGTEDDRYVLAAVEAILTQHVAAELEAAADEIEAAMGRDSDYDDGMEDAARLLRDRAARVRAGGAG